MCGPPCFPSGCGHFRVAPWDANCTMHQRIAYPDGLVRAVSQSEGVAIPYKAAASAAS